jgi:hypothetical protein
MLGVGDWCLSNVGQKKMELHNFRAGPNTESSHDTSCPPPLLHSALNDVPPSICRNDILNRMTQIDEQVSNVLELRFFHITRVVTTARRPVCTFRSKH